MASKIIKWEKGSFPGIRFYKHDARKHGIKLDKYYSGSYQVNGNRKYIGFGWSSENWTEKRVWEKINEYKYNMKTGVGPTTLKEEQELKEDNKRKVIKEKALEEKENMIFTNFWDEYYKPFCEKKKSWKAEDSFFRIWIKNAIGNKRLKDITIFDLEKLSAKMEKDKKSQKTIQHILATIRQAFNRAINLDMFSGANPVSKIRFKKLNNKRDRFLSKNESETLLMALMTKSKQVHDMALISLHTGMRASEIFKLTWSDIDFGQGTIHIVDTKNNESRYAYMSDPVQSILKETFDNKNSNLIFQDAKGKQIKAISKTFARAVNDLGLNTGIKDDRTKVVFHTLRHTFASWQVQAGMDLYTLQKLMGHKSFQMVQRYAHLAPDNLKKATNIFNKSESKVIPFPKQA